MKYTTHKLYDISCLDFFEGSLESLVKNVKAIENRYPNHKNLRVTIEEDRYHNECVEVELYGDLPETVGEKNLRLEREKERKKTAAHRDKEQKSDDLAQLKRLLDKYGADPV